MIYVNQIIALYTLNLHSIVCQSHLNKTGRKKNNYNLKKKKKGSLTLSFASGLGQDSHLNTTEIRGWIIL